MIEYMVDDKKFSISYSELRDKHIELNALTDDEFLARIPEILHFCCVMAWFKELPTSQVLSDTGLIHELAHILHLGESESVLSFAEIRERFRTQMGLDH